MSPSLPQLERDSNLGYCHQLIKYKMNRGVFASSITSPRSSILGTLENPPTTTTTQENIPRPENTFNEIELDASSFQRPAYK